MMSNDPEQKDRKDYVRMSSRSYVMCAQRRRAGWDVRPSLHELTAIKRSGELAKNLYIARLMTDDASPLPLLYSTLHSNPPYSALL
jgi:hypothetical protein